MLCMKWSTGLAARPYAFRCHCGVGGTDPNPQLSKVNSHMMLHFFPHWGSPAFVIFTRVQLEANALSNRALLARHAYAGGVSTSCKECEQCLPACHQTGVSGQRPGLLQDEQVALVSPGHLLQHSTGHGQCHDAQHHACSMRQIGLYPQRVIQIRGIQLAAGIGRCINWQQPQNLEPFELYCNPG